MTRRDLQKAIKENECFILSDGTLNIQHLLCKAYDLLNDFNISTDGAYFSRQEIREHFTGEINWNESLFSQQYYGEIELKEYRHGDIALSPYTTWDDIETFFNNIAPKGYYFGSSEGDGACIGWFKYDEE